MPMARRWLGTFGRWLRRGWQGLVGGSWLLVLSRLAMVAAAFGIAALLFVSAGLVPIAASDGHWPITRALLHFAMNRSVSSHTLTLSAPPLDDPALVLKGAGHYATGCLPCHGAPGQPRSLIVRQMVPEPPLLPPEIPGLEAEELFWIVKHGIKYTAMPAWVAQQRDDEVWAMVAFLQRMPDMAPAQFRRLAYGELAPSLAGGAVDPLLPIPQPPLLRNCVRCHGRDGAGRGAGVFPRLAGQNRAYLRATLLAYARGERHSGIMQPVAAGLDPRAIDRLASYYAGLPAADVAQPGTDATRAAAIVRGARLATQGVAERRIPACRACHGPGEESRNPHYPELAGQYARYLALQLRLFKRGQRGGSDYAHIMHTVAQSLSERDIRDLSLYYASLPPDD